MRTFKQVANYVYETLGPGHEEAIYRDAMSIELQDRGYTVKKDSQKKYFTVYKLILCLMN